MDADVSGVNKLVLREKKYFGFCATPDILKFRLTKTNRVLIENSSNESKYYFGIKQDRLTPVFKEEDSYLFGIKFENLTA